jgi:hypothetical protein
MARELCRRGGLAGALQADEHEDRRLTARIQRARVAAEHGDELVVDDLDERLAGVEAARHFLAERPVADPVDERLRDGQSHVRFEQRHANRPHGVTHVVFGDSAAARHALHRFRETRRQLVEHAETLSRRRG